MNSGLVTEPLTLPNAVFNVIGNKIYLFICW
uniref:Uncharacterized protein n=1 Tax=Anguilla anguilla TaxID=7936 RepID=A0A0E9W1M5_ANGAN